MKLIIDFDEEQYKAIMENGFIFVLDECDLIPIEKAIYNGTPLQAKLEEIKAEIDNIPNDDTTKPIGTYDYCLGAENERKVVLEILDKYINNLK